MKDIEYIVGIYNFFNPFPEEGEESHYYLLYLLDEKGILERDVPQKIFNEHYNSVDIAGLKTPFHTIGPFVSLEKLNQYAFALCEDLNASKISLLSVQEYNSMLEFGQLASDFHRDLLEKGNVLENIERKQKGFLSRFFK